MDIKQIALSFMSTAVRIVILAVAVLVIYKAGIKAYDFGFRIFTEEPMSAAPGRDVEVTIVQGDSLMEIANMLEEKGLVRDAKLCFIQKKVSVYDADVKPGFYTLNTSMTADEMFEIIAGSKDGDSDEGKEEDETTMEAAPLSEGDSMGADVDAPEDATGAGEAAEGESFDASQGDGDSNGIEINME